MKQALLLATAFGLLGAFSTAQGGQFKNVQTNSIADNTCVFVHSSPQNQGNSGSAAMEIEIFEFIPPVADNYKCCIGANTTGQALTVRLLNPTGAQSTVATTAVNGGGCTGNVSLTFPYAYQCTVATGPAMPAVQNAHYTLKICRQ
jgi:hypothetical protein